MGNNLFLKYLQELLFFYVNYGSILINARCFGGLKMMIIIGEKLNSSIPSVFSAFQNNDVEFVKNAATAQLDGGAEYLDVNSAACMANERDKLKWVIRNVLSVRSNASFMIDSPSPEVIDSVLSEIPLKDVIINSITLESERYNGMLPIILKYKTRVVALPITDGGIPETAEERFEVAGELIARLRENSISDSDIFIDALITTLGTDSSSGLETLKTIRLLRAAYPDIHIIGGLSNVSFGLPGRACIDSAFLTAAITCGLDSAIMNTVNPDLRLRLHAALLVNGLDDYCLNYIECYRDNEK